MEFTLRNRTVPATISHARPPLGPPFAPSPSSFSSRPHPVKIGSPQLKSSCPLFSYHYALFCAAQNAIPSVFKPFLTLWAKHPGGGTGSSSERFTRLACARTATPATPFPSMRYFTVPCIPGGAPSTEHTNTNSARPIRSNSSPVSRLRTVSVT